MENWKVEIKRLDTIREKLGLNFNQIQKLTGIDRAQVGGFFNMKNQPAMGFYLSIKDFLEKEIEVNQKEKKEVHRDGGVSVERIERIKKTKVKVGVKPKEYERVPTKIEHVEFSVGFEKPLCDCKMDGMLFIRGKSGCKKTKDEHKF